MRTNVWGAPQGTAKHRFPQDFQLQTLAMVLKKLYNGAYAVRPQAVVQVRISPVQAGGAPTFRQLPHILFSESIIPNGQKIARGISSVGKFRDAKRIDKAGSVPYNKGGRNDARFIHNKSSLFSLRRSCKKESIRTKAAPDKKTS